MAKGNSPTRARARQDWLEPFIASLSEFSSVKRACSEVGISRKTAYLRREADTEFAEAWKAALEDGADEAEYTLRILIRGWEPDPDHPNREPPNMEAIKVFLRAYRPHLYTPAIQVKGQQSLADLRAMTDAEVNELAVRAGLRPETK